MPQKIAVVGKTNPAKGGSMFLSALVNQGYSGKIFVVSTDGGGGMGYDTVDSIEKLPSGIEYAILCVPSREVPDTVRRLARKGVTAAHVFSSGFGDLETDEGRALEAELRQASRETGVRVIGPNCLGVYSPAVGLAFPPGIFPKGVGSVGMVSQSGGTTQALIWCGAHYAYRVNKAVSLGNTVDLSVEDFLEHMIADPAVEVIAVYLEGSADAGRFMSLVKRGSAEKPIIVLKVGMSEAGAKAASSHTGIMAGSGPPLGRGPAPGGGNPRLDLRGAGRHRLRLYQAARRPWDAGSRWSTGVGARGSSRPTSCPAWGWWWRRFRSGRRRSFPPLYLQRVPAS